MPEHILVAVAWPYANGSLHLGHLAGCYLPADIFARYHRLKGDEVLMVSGSDQHGTPVTIRAEQEGVSPRDIVDRYHGEFLRCWEQMGISFDLFTTTGTDNHRQVAQDLFTVLLGKGHISKETMLLPHCFSCRRFLPDRYVEGACPYCDSSNARGDQCDNCGRTLDPKDLITPRCKICGATPEFRYSDHFFLRLSAFQDLLVEWISDKSYWKPNVLNFTAGYLRETLHDRAITRDIGWGVPLPLEGYDDKRIYVWFEAVAGYLSASKEWAVLKGEPQAWEAYWKDPTARAYYFIGKDNIPFHTIIWPAILMGHGGLNLPYDIPANEFLSLEGQQFSTSRSWALWLPDYLERYDPDPLRFYLAMSMPESSDADFSWAEFVRRNNGELVGTFGNLVQRVLALAHRDFGGTIPLPGPLEEYSQSLLKQARSILDSVGDSIAHCRFKSGLNQAMALAQGANKYLDTKAPWHAIRTNREDAATTIWVTLSVINCLKVALAPYLPFTARRLHEMLGFRGDVMGGGWCWESTQDFLPPGQVLPRSQPLYTKLDEEVVKEETSRLEQKRN
jgi:methionyl-tRNA synthetase